MRGHRRKESSGEARRGVCASTRPLARIGVQRDPWEGPSDFAARATQALPNESERVRQISETYIALRYAAGPGGVNLHEFAREVNAFGAGRHINTL